MRPGVTLDLKLVGRLISPSTDLTGSLKRDAVVSLDGRDSAQLDVEEEEDEAVERRAQSVTQTSDACDHPLH